MFLRRVLILDAVASAATGLLMFSCAALLEQLWAVIALNVLWVVDSAALLVSGWIDPALLGYAFVIFQAAVVAVLAELEFIGLRRVGLQPGLQL